jgi:sulfate adenylyltransferase
MITPHGGVLVNRMAASPERGIPSTTRKIVLSGPQLCELDAIGCGLYSPLTGFLCEEDYESVLDEMRLSDGTIWAVPIVLPAPSDVASRLSVGDAVDLTGEDGRIYGRIAVSSVFTRDRVREAQSVYGTDDEEHPGVARMRCEPETLIGGEIDLFLRAPITQDEHSLDPAETRARFMDLGWETVVAFQTRNPIHRAHEYLQKCALEIVDGLFINPLVGETKADDISAEVRMDCYHALIESYYPPDRVVLGTFPIPMRYAGPREAVHHAICRQNYGCTHIIIGRDHAGVGSYYGTYDAQRIFDRFGPDELGIQPLKFEHAFFCTRCGQMVSRKTCPHSKENHVFLSGTKVREMLMEGKDLPVEFTRPEVAAILREAYRKAS